MAANALDRFLAFFAPHAATRRLAARRAFNVLANYEAAKPSHQRAWKGGSNPSPNQLVEQGADAIANIARNLERNHDLTRGIIRTLTVNTIGAQGVGKCQAAETGVCAQQVCDGVFAGAGEAAEGYGVEFLHGCGR